MRYKRCTVCGAIIYDPYEGDICQVCTDEFLESKCSEITTEEVEDGKEA